MESATEFINRWIATPPYRNMNGTNQLITMLESRDAAIRADEAAEQELAEYKRKAVKYSEDSCSGCTATMALRERTEAAEKERDKWKTLAEETEIERERIAARAGEAESRIKELEAAGNKMRHSCILREACDEWDALIDATNR